MLTIHWSRLPLHMSSEILIFTGILSLVWSTNSWNKYLIILIGLDERVYTVQMLMFFYRGWGVQNGKKL